MQTLFFVSPKILEWRDLPQLTLGSAKAALVRPIAAAPCDLDRAIIDGRAPLPGPFSLGHECVAEIVDVGDAVTRLRPGDRVIVPWHIHCGECGRCRRGIVASCERVTPRAMYGTPIGGDWGGLFADLVHVPYAEAMLVPLPDGVSPAQAAAASDNLTDAYLAVARPLAERPEAEVLVLGGAGAIALYVVQMALALGARRVTYVDKSPERLALAAALGAQTVSRDDPAPLGAFDVVVEAAGHPAELRRALSATAPGGFCTGLGIFFLDVPFPMLDLYGNDVTYRTGRPSVGPHIGRALALVQQGKLDPLRISSRTAPLHAAHEVLLEKNLKPIFLRDDAQ